MSIQKNIIYLTRVLVVMGLLFVPGCNLFQNIEPDTVNPVILKFTDERTEMPLTGRSLIINNTTVITHDSLGTATLGKFTAGAHTFVIQDNGIYTDSAYFPNTVTINISAKFTSYTIRMKRNYRTWGYVAFNTIYPPLTVPNTQELNLKGKKELDLLRPVYYWYLNDSLIGKTYNPEHKIYLADSLSQFIYKVVVLTDEVEADNHDTIGTATSSLLPNQYPRNNRQPTLSFSGFQQPGCQPGKLEFVVHDPDGDLTNNAMGSPGMEISIPGRPGQWKVKFTYVSNDSITGYFSLGSLDYSQDSTVHIYAAYFEKYDSLSNFKARRYQTDTVFSINPYTVPNLAISGLSGTPYYWGDTIRTVLESNTQLIYNNPGTARRFFMYNDTSIINLSPMILRSESLTMTIPDNFDFHKLTITGRDTNTLYTRFTALTTCNDTIEAIDSITFINPGIVTDQGDTVNIPLINTPDTVSDTLGFSITNNPNKAFHSFVLNWGDGSLEEILPSDGSNYYRPGHNFIVKDIKRYYETIEGSSFIFIHGKLRITARRDVGYAGIQSLLTVSVKYQVPDTTGN